MSNLCDFDTSRQQQECFYFAKTKKFITVQISKLHLNGKQTLYEQDYSSPIKKKMAQVPVAF